MQTYCLESEASVVYGYFPWEIVTVPWIPRGPCCPWPTTGACHWLPGLGPLHWVPYVHPSLPVTSFSLSTFSFPTTAGHFSPHFTSCLDGGTHLSFESCYFLLRNLQRVLASQNFTPQLLGLFLKALLPKWDWLYYSPLQDALPAFTVPHNSSLAVVPEFTWPTSFRPRPLLECLPSTQALLNPCFKARPCRSISLWTPQALQMSLYQLEHLIIHLLA